MPAQSASILPERRQHLASSWNGISNGLGQLVLCMKNQECGSAGKTCQTQLNVQGNDMVSKPVVPTAKGPELFAQLDEAFSLDSAQGGRHNALHLLRASQADAAPTAAQQSPGESS